jgi:hypothetical protein
MSLTWDLVGSGLPLCLIKKEEKEEESPNYLNYFEDQLGEAKQFSI